MNDKRPLTVRDAVFADKATNPVASDIAGEIDTSPTQRPTNRPRLDMPVTATGESFGEYFSALAKEYPGALERSQISYIEAYLARAKEFERNGGLDALAQNRTDFENWCRNHGYAVPEKPEELLNVIRNELARIEAGE